MKRFDSVIDWVIRIVAVAVIVAALGSGGLWVWAWWNKGPKPPDRIMEHVDAGAWTNTIGDGPIVVVAYMDYQCPFCAVYEHDVWPALKREMVETGRIRYVVGDFPIASHPLAGPAAEAAQCASDQGKYWLLHDWLFLHRGALANAGRRLVLDHDAFQTCVERETTLPRIEAEQALGTRLGVKATPTFFVGFLRADGSADLRTRLDGLQPLPAFRSAVGTLESAIRLRKDAKS